MGDDSPAVYLTDDDPPVATYRASSAGSCLRALVAARLGMDAKPVTDRTQRYFDEGNLHEPAIVDALNDSGYTISDSQRHAEVRITSGVRIFGHIDGLDSSLPRPRLVEIKAMGEKTWKEWVRKRWASNNRYAIQYTIYWDALDNPANPTYIDGGLGGGLYVTKNRNSGELDIWEVDAPPLDISDIKRRIMSVEYLASTETFPACDAESLFGCAYEYLHDPPPTSTDVDFTQDEYLTDLASRYMQAKSNREVADSIVEELRTKILDTMGTREKVITGGFVVERKSVTSARVDTKELKRREPDIADAYTTMSQHERVTVKEVGR